MANGNGISVLRLRALKLSVGTAEFDGNGQQGNNFRFQSNSAVVFFDISNMTTFLGVFPGNGQKFHGRMAAAPAVSRSLCGAVATTTRGTRKYHDEWNDKRSIN